MAQVEMTQAAIMEQVRNWGVEYAGFSPVRKWEEAGDVPVQYYPHSIWPQAKTVIVLAVPDLPVAALPEELGLAEWNPADELMDAAAYRLAVLLNSRGYPSINIPVDSSGEQIVENKTVPVFSHLWAGYYAGIVPARPDRARRQVSKWKLASVLTALDENGELLKNTGERRTRDKQRG